MVDFIQAVKWMKEDKKVRRSCWSEGMFVDNKLIIHNGVDGSTLLIIDNFEAIDWEIFRDDKYFIYICKKCGLQLSEEIMGGHCPGCGEWTYHKDCKKQCVLSEGNE